MTTDSTAMNSVSHGRAFYRTPGIFRRQMILAALVLSAVLKPLLTLRLALHVTVLAKSLRPCSPESLAQQARVILWEIRMPVALMALVVGASLSVAGRRCKRS